MDRPVKKCSNCFKTKPVSEFYRKLNHYQSRCKACNAEVVAGYYERRIQSLVDAGYNRRLATAIARYPREHWQRVKEFQDKRKAELFAGVAAT